MKKKCPDCRLIKPLSEFRYRAELDSYSKSCKKCANAKSNAARTAPRNRRYVKGERSRQGRVKDHTSRYGLLIADYERMLLAQDHKCAICRKEETHTRAGKVRKLCVDHCHTTGKVRGLLCYRCNMGIGYLQDDLERLKSAIEYLSG